MSEQGYHATRIRVRYKDTDRMGVVYYGNYLTFFEVGRTEYMRTLGLPYSILEEEGYTLAVIDASVKYLGNVGYDALVTVTTSIGRVTNVRVRFDYEVLDEEDRLIVTGHTTLACLNPQMKPTRLPRHLRELLSARCGA